MVQAIVKSGRMGYSAGEDMTREQVLKESAPALLVLLEDDYGIGAVLFDTDVAGVKYVVPADTAARDEVKGFILDLVHGEWTSTGDGVV